MIPLDARHIANQQGDFAPQHKNNFMVEIAGLSGDDKDLIVLSLESFMLPNEQNTAISIKYGNEERFVAGPTTYAGALNLVVRDYVDRATRKALITWRKTVYDPDTGSIGLPSEYKKNAEVILMAQDGTHKRVCRLIGVWPESLDNGELSMDAGTDLVKITVPLRFDRAVWKV